MWLCSHFIGGGTYGLTFCTGSYGTRDDNDELWNFFQTLEKLNFVYILDHKCINLDLSKMTSCLCVAGSKPFTYLY